MTADHDQPDGHSLDLSRPTSMHLVGLGGAGMSAIATVLVEMGHKVSGSDLKDGGVLDRLRASVSASRSVTQLRTSATRSF
jgi:UDP-N-acetylmuramate-alanine ligase